LINIKTLQTKQIDNNYFRYWVGFNPLPEIAVSDDGRHIAAMGVNVGFRILDIDDRCGANMSYHNVPKTPIQNPCKEAPIDINKAIDWFRVGHKPSFSSDGGELSFYAESYLVEKREILLRASQYESKPYILSTRRTLLLVVRASWKTNIMRQGLMTSLKNVILAYDPIRF